MRLFHKKLLLIIILLTGLVSFNAHATAISISSALFDLDSLSIDGDVDVLEAELDSLLSINDVNGSQTSIGYGLSDFFDFQSSLNTFAVAGNDGADFLETSTISKAEIINNPLVTTSATSELISLVPFTVFSDGDVEIAIDYELFANASTEKYGESSLSTAAVSFALLDEDESELEFLNNDLLLENFNGKDSSEQYFADFFLSTYLDQGDYFLELNSFAASVTEAVPVPATVFLMLTGLFFIANRKRNLPAKLIV